MQRSFLLKEVENLPKDILDRQPKGLNNTIHWHIGHILTVAEQFMFGYPSKSTFIPESYKGYFGNGTKISDWDADTPSTDILIEELKKQLTRIQEMPSEKFEEKLEKPIFNFETFGELASMALLHEGNHLGQIHSMSLVLKAGKE